MRKINNYFEFGLIEGAMNFESLISLIRLINAD